VARRLELTWYAWFIIIEGCVMRASRRRGALTPDTAATRSELGLGSASSFGHPLGGERAVEFGLPPDSTFV
jgi:hypothetical protein